MIDLTTLQPTIDIRPPRLVVHGTEGVGKTTFASQAPNPIFMDVEQGLTGISAAKEHITTWQQVIEMKNALITQPHTFQTLAIDTADWLERVIHDAVCKANKVGSIDDIGYGKGYGFALDYWEAFIKFMDEIRDKRGMIIILIAHSKVKRFDDPMGNGYDRYVLKMHEKAAAMLQEWADGILFMRNKPILVTEKSGFGDIKKAKDGGVHMYTKETPSHIAKNRAILSLPDEFPVSKQNSWNDFMAQIGKGN